MESRELTCLEILRWSTRVMSKRAETPIEDKTRLQRKKVNPLKAGFIIDYRRTPHPDATERVPPIALLSLDGRGRRRGCESPNVEKDSIGV